MNLFYSDFDKRFLSALNQSQRPRAQRMTAAQVLREMAEVWDPAIPLHLNTAYVERARQLDRDLETAILDDLSPAQAASDPTEGQTAAE